MLFATFCDGTDVMRLGQWPPDAGRRFWRRELSLGRDSARAVRTRDRFVVCGAAHRTVRFWDKAAVNESAFLRGALRQIVAHADGLRLAVRTCPLRKVHQDLSQYCIKRLLPSLLPFLPSPFLSPFLSLFPLDSLRCGGGVRSRCPLSSFHRCCSRARPWAWLQYRSHVVSNGRVFVQRSGRSNSPR